MSYSPWDEILFGVPQGSILGRLLFNIFLCDFFFIMNENDLLQVMQMIIRHIEQQTLYNEVIHSLEHGSMILFKWFSGNQMKASISKYHLLVNKKDEAIIRIGDAEIEIREYEKLLGIKIDIKLNFNEHFNDIISKASRKVNVLSRN